MKIIPNETYQPLFENKKVRYFILMGGRANGRSYTASQYALLNTMASEYSRVAIMRFVLGDIRNSIYQEIIDRIEENEIQDSFKLTTNPLGIEYGANKILGIGFRKSSSDQKAKLKSLANFTKVIIEEADEVSEEDFMQLDDSLRTTKADIQVVLLLNAPSKNHWIIKRWFNLMPSEVDGYYKPILKESATDACYIHGTYLGNKENLAEKTIINYEKYKETKPDHYYNMIMGLVSEGSRGRIFKKWKTISNAEYDELPYAEEFGLDFGFTNDPTTLIGIKKHNNKVYCREYIYETGLTNQMLANRMELLGISKGDTIYADSAEPKSIAELQTEGFNVLPADKGAGSVRTGVDMLLSRDVFYTEESIHIALESQEYKWAVDRNKEPTNEPVDDFNHAMDAIRYNVFTSSVQPFVGVA